MLTDQSVAFASTTLPDSGSSTVNEIMDYVDPIATAQLNQEHSTRSTLKTFQDVRDYTVHDFLARPRVIQAFSIPPGGVAAQWLAPRVDFPFSLFNLPPVARKISGFTYFRGNIKVRVVITAPPTISGAIRLVTTPRYPDNRIYRNLTDTHLQQSQFNNVLVNLASKTPVEMTIPYVYPTEAINILSNPTNFATFRIFRASPSATATANVTVYAWIDTEDPSYSLTLPTGLDYVPRIGYDTIPVDSQVKETEGAASSTSLSKIASAVGQVGSLVKGIPILGSYATPVVTVSNMIAGVAAAFGWSKPNNETPTKIVKQSPTSYNANCDGGFTSSTLGVQALNRVSVAERQFGSAED